MSIGTHIRRESEQSASIEAVIADQIHRWSPYVCQIAQNEDSNLGGTGFLIAPGLIMTCHHVIPDKEAARKTRVIFLEKYSVELDPDQFFERSLTPGKEIVSEKKQMDYVVIALKLESMSENVCKIHQTARSIFENSVVGPSMSGLSGVGLIHYPTMYEQPKKKYYGYGVQVEHRNQYNIFHKVKTEGGSSGAPLINKEGQLIGIHRGGHGETEHQGTRYGTAVSMELIRESLKSHQTEIEQLSSQYAPSFFLSSALRECYRQMDFDIELPMSKTKMSLRDFFTNLVLIKSERQKEKEKEAAKKRDPLLPERDSLIEALDQMTQDEEAIEFSDLFKKEGEGKSPKKVLIVGRAGVGKTTLIDKITFDWLEGESYQDFEAVFRLPLRRLNGKKWVEEALNTSEWISRAVAVAIFKNRKRTEELENYSEQHYGKMLLLLDGFDEADKNLIESLKSVLEDQKLHVIITSRPTPLLALLQGIDRQVENSGFSKKHIEDYSRRFFTSENDRKAFLQRLEKDRSFYSLAHTPLHLQMIVSLWGQDGGNFPATLTALYKKMFKSLRKWNWEHLDIVPALVSVKKRRAIKEVLGIIAEEGLNSGQLMISEKIAKDAIENSKLENIQDLIETGLLKVSGKSCYFIHLTYQEYLIALNLSRQDSDAWREFIREKGFKPQYALVISFLAGLIHQSDNRMGKTKAFFAILMEELGDLCGFYQMELFLRCFAECEREELDAWILSHPVIERYSALLEKLLDKEDFESFYGCFQLSSYIKKKIVIENFFTRAVICLIKKLEVFEINVRPRAVDVLKLIGKRQEGLPEEALKRLIMLLEYPESHVRSGAADVLRVIGERQEGLPEEALKRLIMLLGDPEWYVRSGAADVLRVIGERQEGLPEEALKGLIELLRNPIGDVRIRAADVLRVIGERQEGLPEEALKGLIKLLGDPEGDVRIQAAKALGRIGQRQELPEEALESLIELLRDPEIYVRFKAFRVLCEIVKMQELPEEVAKGLMELLEDPEVDMPKGAVLGDEEALKWQMEVLTAYRGIERWGAVNALGKIAERRGGLPEEVVKRLIMLLKDPQWQMRSGAADVLRVIGARQEGLPEEALKGLIELLKDPKWEARSSAARVLEKVIVKKEFPHEGMKELIEILCDAELEYEISELAYLIAKDFLSYLCSKKDKRALRVLIKVSANYQFPIYFRQNGQEISLCMLHRNEEISYPVTEDQKNLFIGWAREYSIFGDCFI